MLEKGMPVLACRTLCMPYPPIRTPSDLTRTRENRTATVSTHLVACMNFLAMGIETDSTNMVAGLNPLAWEQSGRLQRYLFPYRKATVQNRSLCRHLVANQKAMPARPRILATRVLATCPQPLATTLRLTKHGAGFKDVHSSLSVSSSTPSCPAC